MYRFIKVKNLNRKLVIRLDNPPVNAESTAMLEEILNAVKKVKNRIIVIWGSCTTSKGKKVFSAGGDLEEIKQGKTYQIAKLINDVSRILTTSGNFVVTILGGDAVGGGWGMPFDISDEIYYLKGSSIIAGFTRNGITPGCGISLLIKGLETDEAYKFLISERKLNLDKFKKKCPNIFKQFDSIEAVPDIIKSIKEGKKYAPYEACGAKLKQRDKLALFINEVIENPKKARNIQLKYLKISLGKND